jgi:hypothetical protein
MNEPDNHSKESVDAGLDDARATIAEIWRRTLEDDKRRQAMRALQAVISAEQTMRAADAFLLANGRKERLEAFEKLRIASIFRVGHGTRKTP